jgi:hypothetical protein
MALQIASLPPPQWGDPNIVRERLGKSVRDITFHIERMFVAALSPQHYRQHLESAAGPMHKLVESLSGSDSAKLAKFRTEYDAIIRQCFHDNVVRQDFLLTLATKI